MTEQNKDTSPVVDDGLEAALDQIGDNNAWMWMVFFFASLPGVFNIWALTSYVFLGAELEYWCQIPQLKAANWTDDQIMNISRVWREEQKGSCEANDYNYDDLAKKTYEDALEYVNQHPSNGKIFCSSYAYIGEGTSIVSEWDLVCDRTVMRSNLQVAVALGKLLGALLFGMVADKWGRKCSFVISCAMYIVAGPLGGIFVNYWVFATCRLIIGMAGSGCYNCGFTLLTEVANAKRRTMLGILYNMSYPIGMLLLALIAYLVPMWRALQLSLTVPALLLLVNCWFIPESPRWLLSQGRRDDVWKIVRSADKKLALTRRTEMAAMYSAQQTEPEPDLPWLTRVKSGLRELGSVVSSGELCARLFICHYIWWVSALTYFALSLNADNFSTDRYIYIATSGAVEAVSYVLPIPILHWLGRRPTSGAMFLVSGISLLCIMPIPRMYPMLIMCVAMIGRLCIGAVYSVIVLYTTELFPTVNRNMAVGTSSTMSHLGGIVAPYVVDMLGPIAWFIPSTVCAVVSLVASGLVMLLPETKDKVLCDTVEELKEKGDRVSIRNCCSLH